MQDATSILPGDQHGETMTLALIFEQGACARYTDERVL